MTSRARPAFTVVEIIVAMVLTLAVFAITLPFVRAQTRALGASAGRLDAEQVARYAQRAIDQDLRLASTSPGQPLLVYADRMGIAFNANLFAADTSDPGAADIETGAPTTLTESWRLADASTIPGTARTYPEQDYLDGDGTVSHNETISYFLRPDTITGRSDLYVLYRRVNARDSVQIVRALHVPADTAFFSYYRPVSGVLTRIADARLPLYWDSTAIDSIRSVGVRSAGYFKDRITEAVTIRTVQWTSVLPNAANRLVANCGNAPAAASAVTATKVTVGQPYRVSVTWSRSTDDGAGDADVRQYVVEWRDQGSGGPWSSLATVAATGATTYQWDHALPLTAGTYEYAIRASDCAGAYSTAVTSSTVTLP